MHHIVVNPVAGHGKAAACEISITARGTGFC